MLSASTFMTVIVWRNEQSNVRNGLPDFEIGGLMGSRTQYDNALCLVQTTHGNGRNY